MLKRPLRKAFYAVAPTALTRWWMIGRFEREVAVNGEAELAELHHFVGPGDVVLDIGANYGTYSWLASHLGARVIAFEPYIGALKRLRNMASPSIEIREIALSNRSGSARMHVASHDDGLGTLQSNVEMSADVVVKTATLDSVVVKTATLDRVVVKTATINSVVVETATLDSMQFPKVSFIKIDVEGHEDAVIEGALETIRHHQPLLLVEIEDRHNAGALARLPKLMTGMGYKTWFFRDGQWRNFSEFDCQRDQDEQQLLQLKIRGRRKIDYYNNFLFTPPGYAGARIN